MMNETNTSFTHYIPDPEEKLRQLALGMAVRSDNSGLELLVDNFAGGGGASKGMEMAFGRSVDIAINHDGEALVMHTANHPGTAHYQEDVFEVHPGFITGQRPIGLAWFSPDCKHHSKAKGGKPRDQKIRGLAWVAVKWGALQKPRCIAIENVAELLTWGPLDAHGKPIKEESGRTFNAFIDALSRGLDPNHPDVPEIHAYLGEDFPMDKLYRGLGYKVEYRVLRASDYGVPTTRARLFIFARCDGQPIHWPKPTHGNPKAKGFACSGLKPWRTAAECIDFGLSAQSIFDRPKSLALNTERRVAKGMWRHVLTSSKPFIVGSSNDAEGLHITKFNTGSVGSELDEPLPTVTAGGTPKRPSTGITMGVVAANMVTIGYGERQGQQARVQSMDQPVGTVVSGGIKCAVTAAHLVDMGHGEGPDGGKRFSHGVRTIEMPLNTVTASGATSGLVAAYLEQANGGFYSGEGRPLESPMTTITSSGAQQQLVTAYCIKYYSSGGQWQGMDEPMHTIPTKARMGQINTVKIQADHLCAAHAHKAKLCAQLMHKHLPEFFVEPAEMVMVFMKDQWWVLVDITLRMLTPRELARAQGFPDDYEIAPLVRRVKRGKAKARAQQWEEVPLSKSAQVRMIGNSVCPPLAHALIQANFAEQGQQLLKAA